MGSVEMIVPVVCPRCGRKEAKGSRCECGFVLPTAFVIPYATDWRYDEELDAILKSQSGLRLMGRFVGKNPERLSALRHAQYLYLSRYPSFTFTWLSEFMGLRILELDFVRLKGADGLCRLDSLESMSFVECRELENIEEVGQLAGLRVLELVLCNRVRDLGCVGSCKSLVHFKYAGKALSSLEFLRDLKKLQVVVLNCRVESRDLGPLQGLSLRTLYVKSRNFAKEDLVRYANDHPGCLIKKI